MTLAIKFLVLGVLAVYARAGAVALRRPISDFYVAGRLVPGLFNGMAIALLLIPVLAFAELAGALSQGWEGALLPLLGGAGGLLIIAFLIAPYLRKFGGYTIADFLGERFGGSGVRPLAVLAVILCSFPALALVLTGLGVIAAQIFAVDTGTGIALGVAMLLLCSFASSMGTMRSATSAPRLKPRQRRCKGSVFNFYAPIRTELARCGEVNMSQQRWERGASETRGDRDAQGRELGFHPFAHRKGRALGLLAVVKSPRFPSFDRKPVKTVGRDGFGR